MDSSSLEQAIAQTAERFLSRQEVPENLRESILYSLLAPGKRIRPRLALACASMIDLAHEPALAAGLATEFFHCSTLIHDDLPCMDDDDFRRGRPSNHKQFGEALALLAGDSLMFMSIDVLRQAADHPAVEPQFFQRALQTFLNTVGPRGVMGGQAREPLLHAHSKLADLQLMHAGKTGALFEASLNVPRDLKGIHEKSERGQAIASFAKTIGIGFQVADDLEDSKQDSRPKGAFERETEAITPTSVLFYQSAAEAGKTAKDQMLSAEKLLQQQFGAAADQLLAISAEVKKRL